MPSEYNQKMLFGHPVALYTLFFAEMWERFSYYGMRALLVLYMIKYLLLPAQAGHVVGLDSFKSALEVVFGPLEPQPFASQIYGFYTGLVYLTPIFGGLLADRVLGQRRTVVLGAALMAVGHFMMAFEHLFLLALTVISIGYLILSVITALLKVDFRFWVVTLKTTDFRHFLVMFAYVIPLAIYFFPLAVVLHGTLRPKNGKASFAREMLVNVFMLLIGFLILEARYYIPLTFFGAPSNFGPGGLGLINGLALFAIVPAIALVSTYYFRKTGKIYVGAAINTLFVTWYLVACNTLYSFG